MSSQVGSGRFDAVRDTVCKVRDFGAAGKPVGILMDGGRGTTESIGGALPLLIELFRHCFSHLTCLVFHLRCRIGDPIPNITWTLIVEKLIKRFHWITAHLVLLSVYVTASFIHDCKLNPKCFE